MTDFATIHVFGDTGGHGHALYKSLLQIGLDAKTLKLPADVQVIHVGDLIHKGPNSNEIIEFVDKLVVRNPGQWVQIFGNHEAQHLPGGPNFWHCDCDELTVAILNRWRKMGEAYFAYAIDGNLYDYPNRLSDKTIFISHAGLTQSFWQRLNKPHDAFEVVKRLNNMTAQEIMRPGVMLVGGHQTAFGTVVPPEPGPVWALSTFEVFESWRASGMAMPFVQIAGHTTPYGWMWKKWYPTPEGFIESTQLDAKNRNSFTKVAKSLMIGVDPGFSERIDLPAQPYLTLRARQG